MDESMVGLVGGELVRAYKIHVSSKYLELTRKKLELTRLPHELATSSEDGEVGRDGGVDFDIGSGIRKSDIEPLIDYWLEDYSWKAQETHLNTIPQYRTAITLVNSSSSPPIRLHFIHIPSPDPDAIPLLLIPPFPFTNLSLGPLITAFSTPPEDKIEYGDEKGGPSEIRTQNRAKNFHLIIPSFPGLGFSDALSTPKSASQPLTSTAQLFNTMMIRLGYESYMVSTTSSSSPLSKNLSTEDITSQIPMYISLVLARNHRENCRVIHLFDPPLRKPAFWKETWAWMKWVVARFVGGGILGYGRDDFRFSVEDHEDKVEEKDGSESGKQISLIAKREAGSSVDNQKQGPCLIPRLGQTQTTILSYALCDSPIGMLAYTLSIIRNQSPGDTSWNPSVASSPTIRQIPLRAREEKTDIETETAGSSKPDTTLSSKSILSASYSFKDLIDLTNLSWLPGPEAALRYADAAAVEIEKLTSDFNFDDTDSISNSSSTTSKHTTLLAITSFANSNRKPTPAAWAHHNFSSILKNIEILSSGRRSGAGGLIGFERMEEVVESVRSVGGVLRERGVFGIEREMGDRVEDIEILKEE